MSGETFARILDGVSAVSPRPTVFFGGFGEPFAHPDILAMVAAAKATGAAVELITNGTALDESASRELVRLGLDRLWVSIDGASPESYADVRLRDALPQVVASLVRLAHLREAHRHLLPRIGIAFVAMRRNVADLPDVVRLAARVGADTISVSNVLPHTREMSRQLLYGDTISVGAAPASPWAPEVLLPRMSWKDPAVSGLAGLRERSAPLGSVEGWDDPTGVCPFVERGSVSVRWDGEVSPCLPLLHTHREYLDFRERTSHAWSVGNLEDRSLIELWDGPSYVALRERLQRFDFAPCTVCNSCDMADENLEDCFGNTVPACGGCLWAQGFIQCP
jgi:MoaA/NifB/PqqE/SkfB family radical SAM enzyme